MIKNEIAELGDLKDVGLALIQYAGSLFPGTTFNATAQGRYVASPKNFVTFKIHSKRTKNITVTLRGNPKEFLQFGELPLKADMAGYSSFKFTEIGQLAAAATYIRRAAELHAAGRVREQKEQKLVER